MKRRLQAEQVANLLQALIVRHTDLHIGVGNKYKCIIHTYDEIEMFHLPHLSVLRRRHFEDNLKSHINITTVSPSVY